MKHFILFCLIIIFISACSIFRDTNLSEIPAEDFLSEEGKEADGSSTDSSNTEEVSEVDEEDIEYIDPEDEDILDEGIVVDEDFPPSDIDSILETDEQENTVDEFAQLEEAKDTEYSSSSSPPLPPPSIVQPKKWISLKKIKSSPYEKAGFLVNAVYIARKGDTIESVTQKIFTSDESAQLYAINTYLKNRQQLKIGNKIYYQSPRRSQDNTKILFYFEDIQAEPKYYRVEKGQNIRKVAAELLGSVGGSWKEIWATNPQLVSKNVVGESVEIKYWTKVSAPAEDSDNMVAESPPDESSNEDTTFAPPEEVEQSQVPPPPLSVAEEGEIEPDTDDSFSETVSKMINFSIENIILISLAAISLIMAFVLSKRRRKKAEYDFTAANFEIDDEDK